MLLCPTIIPQHRERHLPTKVVLFRDEGFISSLDPKERSDFEACSVVQTEETWKRHKENIAPGTGSADWAFLSKFQREGYSLSFDPDRLPAPFSKPSLILTGRQDISVGYRDAWTIVENFSRGTYAVLDRAGHDLESEQPRLFNMLMGEWLDRTEESWDEAWNAL